MEEKKYDSKSYRDFKEASRRKISDLRQRWTFRAESEQEYWGKLSEMRRREAGAIRVVKHPFYGYIEAKHGHEIFDAHEELINSFDERMRSDDDFCRGAFLAEMLDHEWASGLFSPNHDTIEALAGVGLTFVPGDDARELLEQGGFKGERFARLYEQAGAECKRLCRQC